MKNLVSVSALYLLVWNFILVLLIYFSLSFPLVFKHHNNLILITTYDFIAVVKSSRVAAFFIFNAIVIAVFFRSFRPFQYYDPCYYLPVSSPSNYQARDDHGYVKDQEANYQHDNSGFDDDDDYSTDQDDLYGGNLSDGYDEDNDDDGGDSSDDSLFGDGEDYDYYDDDEQKFIDLQRRSEEFIAKNNKRWIEELRNERILYITAAKELILTSSSS